MGQGQAKPLPTKDNAIVGRATKIQVSDKHYVLKTAAQNAHETAAIVLDALPLSQFIQSVILLSRPLYFPMPHA